LSGKTRVVVVLVVVVVVVVVVVGAEEESEERSFSKLDRSLALGEMERRSKKGRVMVLGRETVLGLK
jgi:hypothetical protein